MAQGTRGRWTRIAATGLGVLLCTGLVGCMNNDKPKDIKKMPSPGLMGAPTLPPNNTGMMNTGMSRTGQMNPQYGGPGANLQANTNTSPAAGLGAGTQRTGQNTLTNPGYVQPASYMNAPPGAPGTINPPAMQGQAPAGGPPYGPLGAAPAAPSNYSTAAAFNPPAPDLRDPGPIPPAAPGDAYAPVPPTSAAAPQYSLAPR